MDPDVPDRQATVPAPDQAGADTALHRLYAATAAISASIDDEPRLLQAVADEFANLLDARYGALGLLGEDGTLHQFLTTGLSRDEEAFLRPHPPIGRGILGAMLREGRPLRIDDMEGDHRRVGTPVGHPAMRNFLGVPLVASSRVIGRLYATDRRGGPFTATDETLAMGFAAAAAVAIESARRTARLVDSERLRAASELAVGIAHDFNNLLATILGRVDVLLADGAAADPGVASALDAIRRAATDGAVIAGRMRQLGRAVDLEDFRPLDPCSVVKDAIEFTRPRWSRDGAPGKRIDVCLDLTDVPPVDGDPVSIREALTNLIFNAVDAMPEGGTLTVQVRRVAEERVVIRVSDTGTGIPTRIRDQVFVPFFTTKGARGSGLGLAMVRRVMNGHGGSVELESGTGLGTTVSLTFRAVRIASLDRPPHPVPGPDTATSIAAITEVARRVEGVKAPEAAAASPRSLASPTMSIVIVDDQPDVLEAVALLLRLDGHDVHARPDGEAAIAAVRALRPDLVITDLSMPDLDGWHVAAEVRRVAPGTPVIVLTGYGGTISHEAARLGGIDLVVTKPTDQDALRGAIATVTERRANRVLIVDDADGFRAAAAVLVRSLGHEVAEANGVFEALSQVQGGRPVDAVILDANLGDGDASEVLLAIRSTHPRAVVWVTSGSDVAAMRRRVAGADHYVEKVELGAHLPRLRTDIARLRG